MALKKRQNTGKLYSESENKILSLLPDRIVKVRFLTERCHKQHATHVSIDSDYLQMERHFGDLTTYQATFSHVISPAHVGTSANFRLICCIVAKFKAYMSVMSRSPFSVICTERVTFITNKKCTITEHEDRPRQAKTGENMAIVSWLICGQLARSSTCISFIQVYYSFCFKMVSLNTVERQNKGVLCTQKLKIKHMPCQTFQLHLNCIS